MSWDTRSIQKAESALAKRARELVEELGHPSASEEAKQYAAELILQRAALQVRKG